ncbi:hypothetical protein CP533_4923 [Ophiocordyceps camponoti-saundersi (nom. inval.)]|nr:hypothetical protein CP533_4923 [Ophiocordyceps camponoti-saundersi (nom. inval.)]
MAFFPRNFYNSDSSSFTPLFRLLDDFDNYSRQSPQQGRRSEGLPSWQPKFDVRETGENYELHGELPGMNKDQVSIEFTDPQTMLVRGRVERSWSAGQLDEAGERGAITEEGERSSSRNSLHQATVEDESDNNKSNTNTNKGVDEGKAVEKKKPQDKAKYWLTERSVGEFSRSFNFPSRVDTEAVSAQFKDGILNIVVPKAKKLESRRITIT